MILKKIMIRYYGDNLENVKKRIVDILQNFGIFELELIEDFKLNNLDFNENYINEVDLWSIIFYLPNNRFFEKKLKLINEELEKIEDVLYEIYINELDTNSYKDEWKKSFFTTKITDNIVINPSWSQYEAKKGEIVINIDPSMAFGTGTHETTSLCIEMLEKYKNANNMLDIGCGSGILMLVASKLGIKEVEGIDIDKNCESIVKENFEKNNIESYKVHIGNLVDKIENKFSLVVSNILVDVLEILLKDIQKVLKNNSICIFSGILEHKKYKFINKAKEYGLNLLEEKAKNKWTVLVFKYEVKNDNSN